jgi:protein-S-isoprenylcysteine O-methyltransferase Ste14
MSRYDIGLKLTVAPAVHGMRRARSLTHPLGGTHFINTKGEGTMATSAIKLHRVLRAETVSRISHFLFWFAMVLPGTVGLFYPGLTAYDKLFGVPSLPVHPMWIAIGAVLLCFGLVLLVISNRLLIKKGRGAAAFLLTERLVTDGLYGRTRNPISLGFYATCLGIGMIAGSVTVTLGVLLIIVPIHIVNLKILEERELELRYGQAYVEYRQRVPFLIPRFERT